MELELSSFCKICKFIFFLLALLLFFSCEPEKYDLESRPVVILKADDLGNLTPNWERYIELIESNDICGSIGIISSFVTDKQSITRIREIANKKNSDNESLIEFWNHGYDHSEKDHTTEFWGTSKAYQIEHIRRSQIFFMDTLGIECNTFSAPFNRTSLATYNALDDFPEIKILMIYRPSERNDENNWKDITRKWGKTNKKRVRLKVTVQSVYDVPYETIRKHANVMATNEYMIIQIHPNAWDEHDFLVFQKTIKFLRKKRFRFMTPRQYYKYLHQ